MSIYRGTTPTFVFHVSADLTEAEVVYLTFEQGGKIVFELTKDELDITEETIEVKLTQQQTLALLAGVSTVNMQFRAKFADGSAVASNTMFFIPDEILKGGEI